MNKSNDIYTKSSFDYLRALAMSCSQKNLCPTQRDVPHGLSPGRCVNFLKFLTIATIKILVCQPNCLIKIRKRNDGAFARELRTEMLTCCGSSISVHNSGFFALENTPSFFNSLIITVLFELARTPFAFASFCNSLRL